MKLSMEAGKVLVVDDSETNRLILRSILCHDYEVLEAENSVAALSILHTENDISAVLLDIIMPEMDGYEMLRQMRINPAFASIPVLVMTGNADENSENKALSLGANDFIIKPYSPDTIRHRLRNTIKLREASVIINTTKLDPLTGLFNREAFFQSAAKMINRQESGYYVLSCLDIDNFKVINDLYGSCKGDDVLKFIASVFVRGLAAVGGICCRITADNFAVLYPRSFMDSGDADKVRYEAAMFGGVIPPVTISTGRFIVNDKKLNMSAMYDRAMIAQAEIKGRFDVHVAQYDESMRKLILREQSIINEMNYALVSNQFEIWFQPQYNHTSGAIIGAEALVRWRHPEKGLIFPGEFIPIFERNGFIYELDKYVWERVCVCLRKWIDEDNLMLPVSVNISRYDLFQDDMVDVITDFVRKYDIPIHLLYLEITESAFAGSTDQIIRVVKQLITYGFTVEIDDFGSGYSSLVTLKDVPANVLKLDMRFLENNDNFQRGGRILESVICMAKMLEMTVIAEGVETKAQADYLKSIGCNYVQGYMYAKAMPQEEYEVLAKSALKEKKWHDLDETVQTLDRSYSVISHP